MMMPIPMPIYIPHSSGGSGVKCIYPKWASFTFGIGATLLLAGFVLLLICVALWLVTSDDKFDVTEKPCSYIIAMIMIGAAIAIVGAMLCALTGTPITE